MENLRQRTITGAVLVVLIISLVAWNRYSFIFLILIINMLSIMEFYNLFYSDVLKPQRLAGSMISVSMLLTFALVLTGTASWKVLLINIPLVFGALTFELYRKLKQPFYNLAFTISGIVYITIPLIFLMGIGFFPLIGGSYISGMILGYFFILWAGDAGAYFTGRAFGKHPLFERISPHKTWEGSLGGAVCALLISYVTSFFFTTITLPGWVGIALIVIITGTFGDLIKSLMKRSLNIKDSGTILPGHGGMLDRFDSLFGSAPFVFSYLILCYA